MQNLLFQYLIFVGLALLRLSITTSEIYDNMAVEDEQIYCLASGLRISHRLPEYGGMQLQEKVKAADFLQTPQELQ